MSPSRGSANPGRGESAPSVIPIDEVAVLGEWNYGWENASCPSLLACGAPGLFKLRALGGIWILELDLREGWDALSVVP